MAKIGAFGHQPYIIRNLLESILTRSAGASSRQIILWWESQRLTYNLVVGAAGLVTLAVMIGLYVIVTLLQGKSPGVPDMAIVWPILCAGYGVLANIAYTSGWVMELIFTKILKRDLTVYAQASFVVGTIFSVALTLLPALLSIISATVTLILDSQAPDQ